MTPPLTPPAGPDQQASPAQTGDERNQDWLVVDYVIQTQTQTWNARQPPLAKQLGFARLLEAQRYVGWLREAGVVARVMERTRVNGVVTSLIACTSVDQ